MALRQKRCESTEECWTFLGRPKWVWLFWKKLWQKDNLPQISERDSCYLLDHPGKKNGTCCDSWKVLWKKGRGGQWDLGSLLSWHGKVPAYKLMYAVGEHKLWKYMISTPVCKADLMLVMEWPSKNTGLTLKGKDSRTLYMHLACDASNNIFINQLELTSWSGQ